MNIEKSILRIQSIDSDLMRPISRYSNAAVATDRAVIADRERGTDATAHEVRRTMRAEGYALDDMTNTADAQLIAERNELIAAVMAAGVKCPCVDAGPLHSFRELATLIKSKRALQSAKDRCPKTFRGQTAMVQVRRELASCGVGK